MPCTATWGGTGHKKPPQGLLTAMDGVEIGLIVDEQPAPTCSHEPGVAQNPQVLRDSPLRYTELRGQSPNTQDAPCHQLEQAQAHLRGESPQNP